MEMSEVQSMIKRYNQCIFWKLKEPDKLKVYVENGHIKSDYRNLLSALVKVESGSPEEDSLQMLKEAYNRRLPEYLPKLQRKVAPKPAKKL